MANVKNNSASQETRRRLLAAAGAVFADRGFHAATIKEITDRAGASLASVNYHFRDKAELYAAVLRRLAEAAAHIVPPDDALAGDPARRLRQFIAHFCRAVMDRKRDPWDPILMARELAEPTGALDPLYETVMSPLSAKLSALVAELLGLPVTDPRVGLAAAAVIGQCVYFLKERAILGRLHPQLGDRPDVDQIVAHVTAFSLAGIRDQRKRLAGRRPTAGTRAARPSASGRERDA